MSRNLFLQLTIQILSIYSFIIIGIFIVDNIIWKFHTQFIKEKHDKKKILTRLCNLNVEENTERERERELEIQLRFLGANQNYIRHTIFFDIYLVIMCEYLFVTRYARITNCFDYRKIKRSYDNIENS